MKAKVMLSLLGLGFVVWTLGWSHRMACAEPIEIKFAHFMPGGGWNQKVFEEFGNRIEKETNGNVKFKYYPAQTLVSAAGGYDGTVKGVCDIYWFVSGYAPGRFRKTSVLELPPYLPSATDASLIAWDLYKKYFADEWSEVKVLALNIQNPLLIHSKKPISSLKDFEGQTIRTAGLGKEIVQALGGTPVTMPFSDAIEALQKGVVSGITINIQELDDMHIEEVTEYTTNCRVFAMAFFWIMNKKKYESLPREIQKVFDATGEWMTKRGGEIWDEQEMRGWKHAHATKRKVITLTPDEKKKWDDKMMSINNIWVKKMENLGLPAKEILNAKLEAVTAYLK